MTRHRLQGGSGSIVRIALFVAMLTCFIPSPAKAACPIYDDMVGTRKKAEEAFRTFHDLRLDPAIEQKMGEYEGLTAFDNTLTVANDEAMRKALFTPDEAAAVRRWLDQRRVARAALDAANADARKAQQVWRDAFDKKEAALTPADTKFRAEQKWLEAEKEALKLMVENSPEYLDRASRITERLKAAYDEIEKDLAPHRDCFSDVAAFLHDLDVRRERIKKVNSDIARLRGAAPPGVPGVTTLHPDRPAEVTPKPDGTAKADAPKPDPDADAKLGDAWVWDGNSPEVKVITDTKGAIVSKTVPELSWKITDEEGKSGVAGIKLTKGPEKLIYAGQKLELVMTAFGQAPAASTGDWYSEYFEGATWDGHDPGCTSFGQKHVSTWRRVFHVPENATTRFVEARCWRPLPGGNADPNVVVRWTYVRQGGK